MTDEQKTEAMELAKQVAEQQPPRTELEQALHRLEAEDRAQKEGARRLNDYYGLNED